MQQATFGFTIASQACLVDYARVTCLGIIYVRCMQQAFHPHGKRGNVFSARNVINCMYLLVHSFAADIGFR